MDERRRKIIEQIAGAGLDGLLTFSPENRRYATGFTGSAGYVIIGLRETVLLTDSRYMVQAQAEAPEATVLLLGDSLFTSIHEQLSRLGIQRLGFEQSVVTYKTYESMQKELSGVELVPTEGLIEDVRQIKNAKELATLREAARIADEAFSHIVTYIRPGLSERDIALELEVFMRKLGASGVSFETIVASGERSALPHGVASDRVVGKDEFVKLDFGAMYQGYASDITRTVFIGTPTDRHREIYNTVLRAQLKALDGIRAGLTGLEADALARDVIEEAGFGELFGHSLGHGVGLAVHESPRLAKRSSDVLKEGMVVTVEPGIYVPGFGGVRIEDDVLITANSGELLTHSPKDLIIL